MAADLMARGNLAGGEAQAVLEAQAMMAQDPELMTDVERRIRLFLTLDHDQPSIVRVDANRIGQALDNLVSNAIKFTPQGGKVELLIENRGTSNTLRVTDNGYGIPTSEQDRLFERFFRSTTASANNVPGTGLGLTIAKTIIESHGGTISFDSTVGKGTTFTIWLPKRISHHDEAPKHRNPLTQTVA